MRPTEFCLAKSPAREPYLPYVCDREKGHDGDHSACIEAIEWPQETKSPHEEKAT